MEICPHEGCRHKIDDEAVVEVLKRDLDCDATHMCFFRGPCNHKHVLWTGKNKSSLGINGMPDSYEPGYCKLKDHNEEIKKEEAITEEKKSAGV